MGENPFSLLVRTPPPNTKMATQADVVDAHFKALGLQPDKGKVDSIITKEHILEISTFITEWRPLALHLCLTEAAIEEVEATQGGGERLKKIKMLQKWRESQYLSATYRRLIQALLVLQKVEQASDVCRLLIAPSVLASPGNPSTVSTNGSSTNAPGSAVATPQSKDAMGHLLDPEDVDALFSFVSSAKGKWRDIGRLLGFTIKDMEDIITMKGVNQDQDIFQELLLRWLNWAPPQRSFPYTEDLVEALRSVQLHRLALNLERNANFMDDKRRTRIERASISS